MSPLWIAVILLITVSAVAWVVEYLHRRRRSDAVRVIFTDADEGGDNMASQKQYTRGNTTPKRVRFTGVTKGGTAHGVESVSVSSSDEALASAALDSADPTVIVVTPVGAAGGTPVNGTVTVSFTADGRLGDGVKPISDSFEVTFTDEDAVGVEFSDADEPEA